MWDTCQNLRLVSLVLSLGLDNWQQIAERMGPEFNPTGLRHQFEKLTEEFGCSDSNEIDQSPLIYDRLKRKRLAETSVQINLNVQRFARANVNLMKIKSNEHNIEPFIKDIKKEIKDKMDQIELKYFLHYLMETIYENFEKEPFSETAIPDDDDDDDLDTILDNYSAKVSNDESTEIDEENTDFESSSEEDSRDLMENINQLIQNIRMEEDQDENFDDSGVDSHSSEPQEVKSNIKIEQEQSERLLLDDHGQDDGQAMNALEVSSVNHIKGPIWHKKEAKETLKFMEYHRNSPLSFTKRDTRSSLPVQDLRRKAILQPVDFDSIWEKIETGEMDSDEKFRTELWLYFTNVQVLLQHPKQTKWMQKFALETLSYFEEAITSEED